MKRFAFIWVMLFTCTINASSIRIVSEPLPPLHFINEQQVPTGAMVDIVNLLLKKAQLSSTIEILPWARSYQIAQEQNNTLIFSILRGKNREDKFQWVGKIYNIRSYLVSLKSRKDIKINAVEEAKKYSVGTIRSDLAEDYLREKGFSENENLYLSQNYKTLWQMLFNKRTDLAFTNSILWEYEINDSQLDPKDIHFVYEIPDIASDLYIAASLTTDKSIIKKMAQALTTIKEDGRYQAILTKWRL